MTATIVAQQAINGPPPEVEVAEETLEALRRLGWSGCEPLALAHLQVALDTASRAGFAVTRERLVAYGQALRDVARYDVDALMADPAVQTPSGRAIAIDSRKAMPASCSVFSIRGTSTVSTGWLKDRE